MIDGPFSFWPPGTIFTRGK